MGALRVARTSGRIMPTADRATVSLAAGLREGSSESPALLGTGDILQLRQWATNQAGLAATLAAAHAVMLDDTPPEHPLVAPCEGLQRQYNGSLYQRSTAGLRLCFPAQGFVDGESGVWKLEWQLARWLGWRWDTLTQTHELNAEEWPDVGLALDLAEPAALFFSRERIAAAIGGGLDLQTNRFRVGVRAVNRAGLRSCNPLLCTVPPCSCAIDLQQPATALTAWAAEAGVEVAVDDAGPVCGDATAWMCDPWGPPTYDGHGRPTRCHDIALARVSSVGSAEAGFQGATDTLRVQWEGFADTFSGIAQCQIDVEQVGSPGRVELGQRCSCSASLPAASCDCAPSPTSGMPARCEVVTAPLQELARAQPSAWQMAAWDDLRSSEHPLDWAEELLEWRPSDGPLSVCVPSEPFNLGGLPIGDQCTTSIECAPLTEVLLGRIHADADPRVLCVDQGAVPWLQQPRAPKFCCDPPPTPAFGLCLPAALARGWLPTGDGLEALATHPSSPIQTNATPTDANQTSPPVSPPPAGPPPPASPPPPPLCIAVAIDLEVHTGPIPLPHGHTHLAWDVDGALWADPELCATDLCSGSPDCGCLYRTDEVYIQPLCLTPGRHALTLYDRMGFGWFGAKAIVRQVGVGSIELHDPEDTSTLPLWKADVPTPESCLTSCDITGANSDDNERCVDRLFDEDAKLCEELQQESPSTCNCHGCCLETELVKAAWASAVPEPTVNWLPHTARREGRPSLHPMHPPGLMACTGYAPCACAMLACGRVSELAVIVRALTLWLAGVQMVAV